MNSYIFVTIEGYTFQPNSESSTPDVENLQVLGFASGKNEQQAFDNLIAENSWLLDTSFRDVKCIQLKHLQYDQFERSFDLKTQQSLEI